MFSFQDIQFRAIFCHSSSPVTPNWNFKIHFRGVKRP